MKSGYEELRRVIRGVRRRWRLKVWRRFAAKNSLANSFRYSCFSQVIFQFVRIRRLTS